MAVYFVDYENVSVHGFEGLEQLSADSEVCVFYTANADKLTFSLHEKLLSARAKITLIRTEASGKNALDFQLSTWLGYCIASQGAEQSQRAYYIVSKDAGFAPVVRFWCGRGVTLRQIADLTAGAQSQLERQLAERLGDAELAGPLAELLNKYKTKQGVNNALVKKYGSERAGELYKRLKPLLADKKGT